MTITEVRAAYELLRERALALTPPSDSHQLAYIRELWGVWDATLANLAEDALLGQVHVGFLTGVIAGPLTDDAVIEWLDAYPDAIVDRAPGGIFNPIRPEEASA